LERRFRFGWGSFIIGGMTTHAAAPARVSIDLDRVVGEISPLLFGGFAEHMGRCVYGGVYDPRSPRADARGFRKDVVAALRDEMGITTLRYPGGNFVSGYDWKDGIGPKDARPRRRDLAWRQTEPNTFGVDEFIDLCRELGCRPMLGLNFGTGDLRGVMDLVEYCNVPRGTKWAQARVENGYARPHDVRLWCLGNEMDGPWQIGAMDAVSYAVKAREAAKVIKWDSAENQTIVCGSSGTGMETYPEWDRTVLDVCWEQSDYLAMHHYATNWENDTPSYLAYGVELESHVDTLAALLRYTKAKRRSKHDVYLSWDEWNVWYKDRSFDGGWAIGPRLSEETYDLQDALVVAQWMNVFLRRCDVLKIACIAQVVNTIAPIKTSADGLLKETTYWPFVLFRKYARGVALDPLVRGPVYSTKKFGEAAVVDASASFDAESGRVAVFLVNRSQSDVVPVEVVVRGMGVSVFDENHQMAGRDPRAVNSWEKPENVVPHRVGAVNVKEGVGRLVLPPLSFTVLSGKSA
jgi:alpha-N-arabinofuranosidase